MRDDFTKAVSDTLAKRVGYLCSNPGCGNATSGPHSQLDRALNVGVAAHITAASPGGPRYDASLDSEIRKSISNGIWLCQNCAKLVDNDVIRFSTTMLRTWKTKAEHKSLQAVGAVSDDGDLASEDVGEENHASLANNDPLRAKAESKPVPISTSRGDNSTSPDEQSRPHVPPLDQVRELVAALEQFLWHDSRSFNPCPWVQEEYRLPGFLRVVDALSPLRGIGSGEGWPAWLPKLIAGTAKVFDVIAYTWGWGEFLKPRDLRDQYIERCQALFDERYLIPIQDAAKACSVEFNVIERPHWLDQIVDSLPSKNLDLVSYGATDKRFEPIAHAFDRKRQAFLFGESFATLSDLGGDDVDFTAEVILGKTLRQASNKLSATIKQINMS